MTADLMRMGGNPTYLGSQDLEELPGQETAVQIGDIADEAVSGSGEICTVMHFAGGAVKPMILNLTNKTTLCKLLGTRDPAQMKGKTVLVGVELVRTAGGDIIEALRIRPWLPEEDPGQAIRCQRCGDELHPAGRMTRMQLAAYTRRKYGKCLCAMCAAGAVKEPPCD